MIAFSPGLAQGCFELLSIASRNTLTFLEIQSSFAHFGSIATGKIIEAAQRLNWLRANDNGFATLTPWGIRLLDISGYEFMLRRALLDYIDVESPPWVQNATYGRARVLAFASSEVAQVFVEAELSHGTDIEVVTFWDSLAARARGQKNSRLTAIGRQGERLTIAHEEARTGRMPKWVAIESNEDGYDVLSVVGTGDLRQLSIEVKATTMGYGGAFHITQNEWERSQKVENHLFHLWAINPGRSPALAVITSAEMEVHIPVNSGSGSWELVEIPFSAFRANFQTAAS